MNLRRATVTAQGGEIALRAHLGNSTTGFVLAVELDPSMAIYLAASLAAAVRECDGADLATMATAKRLEEALKSQPPLPEFFPTAAGEVPAAKQPQPLNPS